MRIGYSVGLQPTEYPHYNIGGTKMKDFIPKIIEFAAFIIFVIAIVIYAMK
jgi:hypothetical protein